MGGRVAMKDAKYKAYGQNLTISKGEFLFNGLVATGEEITAILTVPGRRKRKFPPSRPCPNPKPWPTC